MKRIILANTASNEDVLEYISTRYDVSGPKYRGDAYPQFDPSKVNESEFADNLRYKYTDCRIFHDGLEIRWYTQEPFTDDEALDLAREIERCVDFLYEKYNEDADEEAAEYPRVYVEIRSRYGDDEGYYEFSFGG